MNITLKRITVFLAIWCFTLSSFVIPTVTAQNRDVVIVKNPKRIALVIGNANYTTVRKLDNPVNDANDLAKTLEELGFEVISGVDLTRRQMTEKAREFGDRLRETKAIGLFYYAGHGIQVRGKNYLVPVNAEISREDEVDFSAFDVNVVLQKMATANNGLNIVILDACRNNPFARSWSRSTDEGGLAQLSAPTGTFISYATAPNQTASDGTGRNGLYTGELLKYLKKPGLKIEEAFKQVSIAVDQASEGKQIPWTSSSLRGDFYFNDDAKKAEITTTTPEPPPTVTNKATPTEEAAWDLVKDSDDIGDLNLYLQEFPNGFYSKTAKFKVKLIEKKAWNSVKDSEDSEKIQSFLNRYPKGDFAPVARILLRQLSDKKVEQPVEKTKELKNEALKPGTPKTNAMGIDFVWIPPGQFMMGSEDGGDDEKPVRRISIKEGFWMGKYEVTQEQFEKIMGENPSKYKKCGGNCPVESVTWDEAKDFIKKLNEKNDGFIYSLPSEAEWEYAARAGTTTRYYFGDDDDDLQKYGRHRKTSGTHPVGELIPNNWGLYDIHGNVWEWCEDIYDKDGYGGLPVDGSANTTIGEKSERVLRGGSWFSMSRYLRTTNRDSDKHTGRDSDSGFRLVARPGNTQ